MVKILLTEEEKKIHAYEATLRWRNSENGHAMYNANMKKASRIYYEANKIIESEKSLKRYYFKRECAIQRKMYNCML
jgi:hypothetical protein